MNYRETSEIKKIVAMYIKGKSLKEISKEYNTDYQNIANLIYKLRKAGAIIPKQQRRNATDFALLAQEINEKR